VVSWLKREEDLWILVEREGELWFIGLKEKEYCGLLVDREGELGFIG